MANIKSTPKDTIDFEYYDEQTKCVKQYGPNNSHENNWMFMPHPKCCKNITSTIPLPTIQEQECLMSTSWIPTQCSNFSFNQQEKTRFEVD